MDNFRVITIYDWIKCNIPFLCFDYEYFYDEKHFSKQIITENSPVYIDLLKSKIPFNLKKNYSLLMKLMMYPSQLDSEKKLYDIRILSNQQNHQITHFLTKELNLLDMMDLQEFDRFHESEFTLTLKESNRIIIERIINKIMLFFICPMYYIEKGNLFEGCPLDDIKLIEMINY